MAWRSNGWPKPWRRRSCGSTGASWRKIRGAQRNAEARVYALLRATTIARLREANPKVLEDEGLS